jgi:hypothetical protein
MPSVSAGRPRARRPELFSRIDRLKQARALEREPSRLTVASHSPSVPGPPQYAGQEGACSCPLYRGGMGNRGEPALLAQLGGA